MSDVARRRAAERLLGLEDAILVLASASSRRRELLSGLGLRFEVRVPSVEETLFPGNEAGEEAVRLAALKARAVAAPGGNALVLAADTLVVVDGAPLGKPRDRDDARGMLGRLAGRDHEVVTGVAVVRESDGRIASGVERTRVTMARFDEETLAALLDGEEWGDKAGAYAVQGLAGLVIDRLDGDYFNVVGLPLARVRRLLHELRADDPRGGAAASRTEASR